MRSLRRFGLLFAVAAGSAVLAGPAFGARPGALAYPLTIQTPHFVVHYQSDLLSGLPAITQTTAGDVAAIAERAYKSEIVDDGFPVPPSDGVLGGDGRIDVYVDNPGALALTVPDNLAASPTTAYIELDGAQELALQQHTIAHELFHVIQLGIWQPLPFPAHLPDYWLLEGSAEWMGFRVDRYDPSFGSTSARPTCRSTAATPSRATCATSSTTTGTTATRAGPSSSISSRSTASRSSATSSRRPQPAPRPRPRCRRSPPR